MSLLVSDDLPKTAVLTIGDPTPMPDVLEVTTLDREGIPLETVEFVPRAENDRLRDILRQVVRYDRHTLNCTACACGLYCPIEVRERKEIMKAVYRELEE